MRPPYAHELQIFGVKKNSKKLFDNSMSDTTCENYQSSTVNVTQPGPVFGRSISAITPLTEDPSGKLTVTKLGLPGQSSGISKLNRASVGLSLLVR
jgi:hypothetical protein